MTATSTPWPPTHRATVGDRVRYEDMANPRREATVTKRWTWSHFNLDIDYVTVEFDDGTTDNIGAGYMNKLDAEPNAHAGWALVSKGNV